MRFLLTTNQCEVTKAVGLVVFPLFLEHRVPLFSCGLVSRYVHQKAHSFQQVPIAIRG